MNKQATRKTWSAIAVSLAIGFAVPGVPVAYAHTGESHKKHDPAAMASTGSTAEHAFGKQGDPKKAVRTIAIDMNDNMRFGPAGVVVRENETVRFVVTNKGKLMHEMVIGTLGELKAHGEMMKKHAGMQHDAPYMAHVGPGKKESLVWQFTRAGEFYYACLVPGHFEAGMIGKITVTKG